MFEVRLDRSYYSMSQKIFDHIKKMFDYEFTPWLNTEMAEGKKCSVAQNFGYTTIIFEFEKDLKDFKKWLETQE